jgi:uncharacterized RDD family membrane protein YckC
VTAHTDTPDPTAVLVRRVIAHLLDAALYAVALLVPVALFADSRTIAVGESLDRVGRLGGEDPYVFRGNTVYFVTQSELITAALIALGVFLLTAVVMQGLTGRTAGKWVTGVRAVRPDGSNPGLGRAFVRELCWIIDGIPSFVVALVGGILALVTTGRRRVGDFLGRTYVVHRRFAGMPIVAPGGDTGAPGGPDEAGAASGVAVAAAADDSTGAEPVPVGDAVSDDRAATEAAWAPAAEGPDEAAPAVPPAAAGDQGEPAGAEEPAEGDGSGEEPAHGDGPDDEGETAAAGTVEPTPPRWDPDRRAYISYDPRRGGWLQHDTETGEWGPISRA